MIRKSILASTALVAAISLMGADDYVFETVKPDIKSSNVATVAVRLLHKPTGKPVVDATIVQTRLDMAPMAWPTWLRQSSRCPAPNPACTLSRRLSRWPDAGN